VVEAALGERGAVAATLRRLRLRAGLSQQALAEKAGVGVATIGAIEEGQRRRPYPHTLRALADALDLSAPERAALLSPQDDRLPAADQVAQAPQAPPTPLVGRASTIAELNALLSGQAHRLVTLIGPGGVGKTRLALAVADSLPDAFADGLVFVDLAPMREHRLVAATIARGLGIHEAGGHTARELLIAHLQPRHALLILDNFEHLLGAAPLLAELVATCPRLSLLVTSRTALRIRSERRMTVPPLATPPIGRAVDVEDVTRVASYPAVQLFVERLQNMAPEFTLDSENAPIVADICRKLDGIPLALELAAARAQLLTPRALLNRLERRLQLLSSGPIDLPERQRTLGGALGWSYDLLEPPERAVFRRLSVFVGGWTLEAAEAVCADTDVPTQDVVELMSTLIDSSMVRRLDQTGDEPRFGTLETLREYGLELLRTAAEEADVRNRHLAFYVAMVEAMEPNLHGGHREASAERVEGEIDNLRAAIAWSVRTGQAVIGLRLVSNLRFFWYMRGHQGEAGDYLQMTLAATDGVADLATRGRGLATLGYMLTTQGQFSAARRALEDALNISRELSDVPDAAFALRYLGLVDSAEGQYAAASAHLEESLSLYRRLGSDADVGLVLSYLGDVAVHRRDYEHAEQLLVEGSEVLRRCQYMMGLPWPVRRRALLACIRGDMALAVQLAVEALMINLGLGERQGVAASLVCLAQVADVQAQPEIGVQLLGKAEAFVEPTGLQLLPFDREQHEIISRRLRSQLAAATWDAAWEAGRGLSLDQAIHAAQALRTSSSGARAATELTDRQREILRLVAAGQTNREIAGALQLSVATVERHLATIYTRIGARGRADATRYAVRTGLITPTPAGH
jgi:predicted ATPase/DNA-binding CsgD family transcriptional regulator/DNA-binding XRE family transcriptional regulator